MHTGIVFTFMCYCGMEADPAEGGLVLEVRIDEDLLSVCTRWEAKGLSCSRLNEQAAGFQHPLLSRDIRTSDLPPRRRAIKNLLAFEGLFPPGRHVLPLKDDPDEQARLVLEAMLAKSEERFARLEQEVLRESGKDAERAAKDEAGSSQNAARSDDAAKDHLTRDETSGGEASEFKAEDSTKTSRGDRRLHSLDRRQRVILASIVEKEAVSNQQYERVASAFLNRLSTGQVLGSCPTVEYGLGYHRPFLLFKDLELQSDYNVYRRPGLPPGPVAQFSDDAYRAVLNPARTRDVFFVYDWTSGQLHFAVEYREHKNNAARARKNFIERYGKDMMYRRFDDLYYEDLPESRYGKGD